MADTFKKSEKPAPPSASEDAWKDVNVEKEHQPEKTRSTLTYRRLEEQMEHIERNMTTLTNQKTVLEAEMLKVKTIAEAE